MAKVAQELHNNCTKNIEGGNTVRPRIRMYQITLNTPTTQDIVFLKNYIKNYAKNAIWQIECGEKGEREHYHAHIELRNAKTFNTIKSAFPKAHIEAVKDRIEDIKYCCKKKTRIDGPFITGKIKMPEEEEEEEQLLPDEKMYPWQRALTYLLETEQNTDYIHYIYDNRTHTGKTELGKELYERGKGKTIYVTGCSNNIKCFICALKEEKNIMVDTIIFNIPRSESVDYVALEEIKDGIFFSGKYEPKIWYSRKRPNVVVFSNNKPSEKISTHKLNTWTINEKLELEPYKDNQPDNKFIDEGIPINLP